MHALIDLTFASLTSEKWDSLPDFDVLQNQIGLAAIAQSEITEQALGLYSPPSEIRNVYLTHAAADQIRCMWHGHRSTDKVAPPVIPLKLFVCGGGQDGEGRTWADIEVHPGFINWAVED